jgi:hypothetical protein
MPSVLNDNMGKPFIDLTNQVFVKWTVSPQHKSVPRPSGKGAPRTHWFCTCSCGNTAWVDATNLRQSISTNCGCLRETKSAKQQAARSTSGKANTTHGMSKTSLYRRYAAMIQRCYNPNTREYRWYGNRGIKICDRWKDSFENFLADMGPTFSEGLSLERNNNDGDYSPENCKWIPRSRQVQNRTNTVKLNETLTISDFCNNHNVDYDLVWHAYYFKTLHPEAFSNFLQVIDYQVPV